MAVGLMMFLGVGLTISVVGLVTLGLAVGLIMFWGVTWKIFSAVGLIRLSLCTCCDLAEVVAFFVAFFWKLTALGIIPESKSFGVENR